ncbi:MAG TPA: hypothetical protein VI670_15005 [Thermoanaerobaculia bacterium]|jgi:hypothetical protein
MRKSLLLFSLLAVLAAPAMAAPRDDDPRGPRDTVRRIVLMLERLVHAFDDPIVVGPPKP